MIVMPERDVLRILAALNDAEVRFWVAGGWGIDALMGRQTRRHSDLDLVLDQSGSDEERARRVLANLGFRFENVDAVGDSRLPRIVQLHDRGGRVVELLPVDLMSLPSAARSDRPPSREGRPAGSDGRHNQLFAVGRIGSRAVTCLAPAVQLALHQGYDLTLSDRRDVALLCRRFGLAPP